MSRWDVHLHVPGDYQACIEKILELGLATKRKAGSTYICHTYVCVAKPSRSCSELYYYPMFGDKSEGKPIVTHQLDLGMGFSASKQEEIFKKLKNAVMASRRRFFKEHNASFERSRDDREAKRKAIMSVVNAQKSEIVKEHNLVGQVNSVIAHLQAIEAQIPESIIPGKDRLDHGSFNTLVNVLREISTYVTQESLLGIKIAKGTLKHPSTRIYRAHLKELAKRCRAVAQQLKYLCRSGVRYMQLSTYYRKEIKAQFEPLRDLFALYESELKEQEKKLKE